MRRREFLKTGLSAAAVVSLPGLLSYPKRSEAAQIDLFLSVDALSKPVFPGIAEPSIPMWQFTDTLSTSQFSQLTVVSGDTVTINLQNNLQVPVNFVIPGLLENTQACLPGQSVGYSFVAPPTPGTYLFFDNVNGEIGRAMGLGGAIRVMPADGIARLYDGGPTYNRDHLLVFNEVDTRLNEAIAAGGSYDMAAYQPNYFFVNGISYSTIQNVVLEMSLGENVAFRFVNAGLIYYPMHFHGYHVNVATRNRVPELAVIEKDTVLVKTNECVEVILPVGQTGEFPLHTHFVPGVTNNGVYAGGGLIKMLAA